jgi:Trk K+ transport system NAD-binding subunit
MGPRGIIPASVATLFAIELATAGNETASQLLLGTVFIVIGATDAIEAGLARQIGDVLGVTPMRTIIVGGGRVGLALATRLERRGEYVVVVESDEQRREKARDEGFTVHNGDGTDTDILQEAGMAEAKTVVAATADDNTNLFVSQTAKTKFEVENVYARVNNQRNMSAFEALSVTAIDSPMATAFAIDNEIERPELAHWMQDLGDNHDIQETVMTAKRFEGESIRSLNDQIPGGCLVAEIGQGTDAHVPDPDEILECGDHITFLGDANAVREVVELFHPHD